MSNLHQEMLKMQMLNFFRIPWCEQTGMTRDWDATRSRARVQITKPLCRAESGQEVLTLYYFPHPGTRPCFPVNLPETQLRPVSRWIVSLINRTHRGHSSFWFHVKPLSLRWIKKYIFGIQFVNKSQPIWLDLQERFFTQIINCLLRAVGGGNQRQLNAIMQTGRIQLTVLVVKHHLSFPGNQKPWFGFDRRTLVQHW